MCRDRRDRPRQTIRTLRRPAPGISGSLTKTFTMLAQASDASRWVRASPQKIN
ncbi:MAG: hypothetical protein MPL62_09055 [Alphaproteobacteria bacterium]|nr:hypothetical protein [Alphaproteobacteria bacterium]